MSYEAWRITFQDSEQAARSAYKLAHRNPPFVSEWHARAVALGYDGVADMLDSVERNVHWEQSSHLRYYEVCPSGKCSDPARECFGSGCI